MKTYEIRITDTAEDNDMATLEMERSSDNDTAQTVLDIVMSEMSEELEFLHGTEYVVIFPASDGEGYMYDVYESRKAYKDDEESIHGGQCTGSLADAIEMAIN